MNKEKQRKKQLKDLLATTNAAKNDAASVPGLKANLASVTAQFERAKTAWAAREDLWEKGDVARQQLIADERKQNELAHAEGKKAVDALALKCKELEESTNNEVIKDLRRRLERKTTEVADANRHAVEMTTAANRVATKASNHVKNLMLHVGALVNLSLTSADDKIAALAKNINAMKMDALLNTAPEVAEANATVEIVAPKVKKPRAPRKPKVVVGVAHAPGEE